MYRILVAASVLLLSYWNKCRVKSNILIITHHNKDFFSYIYVAFTFSCCQWFKRRPPRQTCDVVSKMSGMILILKTTFPLNKENRISNNRLWQALSELLPSLKTAGHRVLIFSQWTSMLDILEWTLDVIGVTYSRLDGRYFLFVSNWTIYIFFLLHLLSHFGTRNCVF